MTARARSPISRAGLFLSLLLAASSGSAAPSSEAPLRSAQVSEPAPPEAKPPADAKPPAAPPEAKPPADAKPAAAPAPRNLQPIDRTEAFSILGKKVAGPAGENMGRVVDVLVDAESRPRAAVIDFGGFLGVGSRKIAVDWQLLQFRPDNNATPIVLNANRAEVQAAPEYKTSNQPAEVVAPAPPTPAPPDAEK